MNRSTFYGLFGKAFTSLSLMALVFVGSPALIAQEGAVEIEEVTVTGSRIKRESINSASVITTITSEDIENSLKWCLQRGNRTGRSAWQYIIELAAIKNLKINF